MVWIRFCHRISFIASDTYGADGTRSLAFSYCLLSNEHDLAHRGFPSAFQQNFPSLPVCNTRKREQSRKTAINFSSDGRLGPIFFVGTKTTRTMPWESNLVDFMFLKNYTKTKWFPGPEQSNGMDSASVVASPSSLLTPTGRMEHNL